MVDERTMKLLGADHSDGALAPPGGTANGTVGDSPSKQLAGAAETVTAEGAETPPEPRFPRLVPADAIEVRLAGAAEESCRDALAGPRAATLNEQLEKMKADPIAALAAFAEAAGYGPQQRQLQAITIAGVSAAANSPLNLLVLGDFSDGKSTVGHAAFQLLGPDFVAATSAVQRVTPAALVRMGMQVTGRCVLFDERDRRESKFESAMRMVSSGQSVIYVITLNGRPVELRIDPPVAIVDLALLDRPMSLQDRSRYLGIRMGADAASREAVSVLSLQRYMLHGRRRAVLADDFALAFQAFLAGLSRYLHVVVPFANLVRLRTASRFRDRLVNNVLNAVSAVAWLRQTGRSHHNDEELGTYIEATPDDYQVVYEIVTTVGDDGSDGELSDNALTLFRRWSAWARANGNQGITRNRFVEITGGVLSPWQTYRALGELADAGYASGSSGRGKTGQWRLTDLGLTAEHPNLFRLLPSPAEIVAGLQNCKPLT